jgi:hypothetical protein
MILATSALYQIKSNQIKSNQINSNQFKTIICNRFDSRFPYLCYKNGGGAFLIPYFLLIITGAVPMYYLEVLMGQYTRRGCVKIWDICPIWRGIGIGVSIMMLFVNVYFIILMVWPMHFMFASLVPLFSDQPLPWTRCDAWWNTDKCRGPDYWGNSSATRKLSNDTVESTVEYWE